MFYRALVAGIVAFWLGMTFLLVRMEWSPREREALSVPTAYLWKLVFLHEEPSNLVLYYQKKRIGNLTVQPRRQATDHAEDGLSGRELSVVGGFSADLPWMGHQNVVLHAVIGLDKQDAVEALRVSAVLHPPGKQPGGVTVVFDGRPSTGIWHYSAERGGEMLAEDTGTVAHLLDRPELRALGIDPASIARQQQQRASDLTVTAHHGRLRLNMDEIETYVVSIEDASGFDATIHLNQLGQVLALRTFAGVDLLDGALNP